MMTEISGNLSGKERKAERQRRYRQTEKGKLINAKSHKKWRHTKHGRQILLKCIKKYQQKHVYIRLLDDSIIRLTKDSLAAKGIKFIKKEYRTRQLLERLQNSDKAAMALLKLVEP